MSTSLEFARVLALRLQHSSVCGLAALATASTAFAGPVWELDYTDDAKDTATTAQVITASTLTQINGKLTGSALVGDSDFVDMYLLLVDKPAIVSFSTAGGASGGYANFDSQLFLFRADGDLQNPKALAALANRNANPQTDGAFIGNQSSDGNFKIDVPGLYFIAIAGVGAQPIGKNSAALWPNLGSLEVGFGGLLPHVTWGQQGATGEYSIRVTGVTGVPAPGALALLGLAGLVGRRRR
jgi:MYXO-CTERM domain-containing protein